MSDSAGLDFPRAFHVPGLEAAPGDQCRGRDEHFHVGSYFCKYGGCRAFLHAGDGLQVLELPGEFLFTNARQFLLAFFQMFVVQFDFLAVLPDQVDVRLRDHSGQGGLQGILAHPVHRAPVYSREQFVGTGHAIGQQLDDFLVTPAVGRGDIVANPDIATLEQGVQFGELANLRLVQVEDATVVLTHALHEGIRDKTSTDKVLQRAFRYPGGIPHIALATGKLFDEIGVHQFQGSDPFQDTPDRMPVDAGAFHCHLLYLMVKEQLP